MFILGFHSLSMASLSRVQMHNLCNHADEIKTDGIAKFRNILTHQALGFLHYSCCGHCLAGFILLTESFIRETGFKRLKSQSLFLSFSNYLFFCRVGCRGEGEGG